MNNISKLSKFGKNVILGINNIIGDNVIISDNVIIGSNNKIFSNNIIYPNVELGDNNVILEGNIIGEHPVNMDEFNGKMYNGVKIGNNNYFHCKSVISGGTQNNKTIIGNNNKISYNAHIGHDSIITNNVHIYPNAFIGGHSVLLYSSGIGAGGGIHQKRILGRYSFIGMGSITSKHVFPYYIYAGKYLRMNTKRVPDDIHKYDKELQYLVDNYNKMSFDNIRQYSLIFPNKINEDLSLFFNVSKDLN